MVKRHVSRVSGGVFGEVMKRFADCKPNPNEPFARGSPRGL